jgi:hypothetical protein
MICDNYGKSISTLQKKLFGLTIYLIELFETIIFPFNWNSITLPKNSNYLVMKRSSSESLYLGPASKLIINTL